MKLKDFIKKTLKEMPEEVTGLTFNIGLTPSMEVSKDSPNKVKFSVDRKNMDAKLQEFFKISRKLNAGIRKLS